MYVLGYGQVFFFTRNYGRWRSGNVLVSTGLGGGLKGHEIRYMHLGAIKPHLKPGSILQAGVELGLMGCTAIQHDVPHVHIDVKTPKKQRIDVARWLGVPGPPMECPDD